MTEPIEGLSKNALKEHAKYFSAPQNLRDNIMLEVKSRDAWSFTALLSWFSMPFPSIASSFAMGAVLAALVTGQWMSTQDSKQAIYLALASDHAHAIVTENTIEVRSSNMHTVKPWLSSQLGYSPLITDLADHEFPLMGGRRGFIGASPVAVAVYAFRQHEIDVYALRPEIYQQFPKKLNAVDGFNAIVWRAADLYYIAVSDMNYDQLINFAKLLENNQKKLGVSGFSCG